MSEENARKIKKLLDYGRGGSVDTEIDPTKWPVSSGFWRGVPPEMVTYYLEAGADPMASLSQNTSLIDFNLDIIRSTYDEFGSIAEATQSEMAASANMIEALALSGIPGSGILADSIGKPSLTGFYWDRRLQEGTLAIEAAVGAGNVEAYKVIIAAAPELINIRNANGESLLHCAALSGSVEMVEAVLADGPDLLWAQRKVQEGGVRYYEYNQDTDQDYVDPLLRGKRGQADTPRTKEYVLHDGRVKEAWGLFDDSQNRGDTVLQIGVDGGYSSIVKAVLDAGFAKKEFRNVYGEGVLHQTTLNRDLKTTKVLIDGGVDPLAANIHGEIALHWSGREGTEDIGKVLVQAAPGSELIKNNQDQTPLDLRRKAIEAEHRHAVPRCAGKGNDGHGR